MSLSDLGLILFPEWLRDWIRFELLPMLGLNPYQIAVGTIRGMFDTILLIFLGIGILNSGRSYMVQQYTLPPEIQATALKWAPISDNIARQVDIPREVPLVLWFKENSMQAVNPDLCTGIIGAYDLVRSGERACFTPGPISDIEVSEQLTIAAIEFKKRCQDITYYTQDPDVIKRCYFAYNAGVGAAAKANPDESAYVMNNYDETHRNMVYSDVVLGTVRVEQLGAWPTHLAMQSLIISQLDSDKRPFSIALLDTSTRIYDWLNYQLNTTANRANVSIVFPAQRTISSEVCINKPHELGLRSLKPTLNPVTENPVLTQDIHGCSYALPGIDITSNNRTAILQAPMPGEVTTFTDQWYNSTIRIENDEWIVLMLHPRSYLVSEGFVRQGQEIGIMGAVGNATGPHVHYTIYDKVNETFVDPALFLP
jgi:hypothetical protein